MKKQKQLLEDAEKFWDSYPTNLLYDDYAISVQNTFKLMAEFAYDQIQKLNKEKNATKQDCDHNWKEWEDESCNAQMRCTKCKDVKQSQ